MLGMTNTYALSGIRASARSQAGVRRDLSTERALVFVIDGSKALRSAIAA
jgi:hypothetical protein